MSVDLLFPKPPTKAALQVARDYLLEHWSPSQESPRTLAYLTDYFPAGDRVIMSYLPHYRSVYVDPDDHDYLTALPLFTQRMAKVLAEIGVPIWHQPTRNGPWAVLKKRNKETSELALRDCRLAHFDTPPGKHCPQCDGAHAERLVFCPGCGNML